MACSKDGHLIYQNFVCTRFLDLFSYSVTNVLSYVQYNLSLSVPAPVYLKCLIAGCPITSVFQKSFDERQAVADENLKAACFALYWLMKEELPNCKQVSCFLHKTQNIPTDSSYSNHQIIVFEQYAISGLEIQE
jgi:hypothetical protein